MRGLRAHYARHGRMINADDSMHTTIRAGSPRGRALSRPAAAAEVAEVDTDAAERESSSLL